MKNIITLLLVCLMISCTISTGTKNTETKFDKLGISFTCPAGWRITDQQDIDSSGYYLSCERQGFTSSGIMTITWVNDSIDLFEMLRTFREELKHNEIYKNANLRFQKEIDTTFKHQASKAMMYSLSLLGIKHRGIIYCFHSNGKTFSIMKQEALEDIAKNRLGFEKIESSFASN